MKQRAMEILFKHKLLIVLPVLMILPLSIWAAMQPKSPRWQTFAVVWIDQYTPLYQENRLGFTPAANQAALFNDFVRTRNFAREVMQQTDLAPYLGDPAAEEVLFSRFRRAVFAYPTSNTFVAIAVTMEDPDLTWQIGQAAVVNFQDHLRRQLEEQSEVAQTVALASLQQTEANLSKARRELAAYLAAHPELQRLEGVSPSLRDPNLGRLNFEVQHAETGYTGARTRYEGLINQGTAGIQGQQFTFTVIDQPERPLTPITERRLAMIKLPAVGLVLGTMLASGIAVLLILTNRSVLGGYDLQGALGLPVLGEVPELRRRRWLWQRAPRDAVRLRLTAPGHIVR